LSSSGPRRGQGRSTESSDRLERKADIEKYLEETKKAAEDTAREITSAVESPVEKETKAGEPASEEPGEPGEKEEKDRPAGGPQGG
jgi:hypothetical protein